MNINELILIVRNKLETAMTIQEIKIEDKSFLHKNHKEYKEGKNVRVEAPKVLQGIKKK